MTEEFFSMVPLFSFDSDGESSALEDSVLVRRIKADEIRRIRTGSSDFYRPIFDSALTDVKYVLERKFKASRKEVLFKQWTEKALFVKNTLLALRLLKAGYVNVSCAFLLERNQINAASNPPYYPPYLDSRGRDPYFLETNEVPRLKKLWKDVRDLKKKYLRFPLEQFTKEFEDTIPEDAIVNCMIALESLIFHGVKDAEFIKPASKVIGIATGMALGNNYDERSKIRETLTKAYDARNGIVHRNLNKLKKYEQDMKKLALDAEENLRRVLRKFIEE